MTSVYDIAFSFVETLVSKNLYIDDTQQLYAKALDAFSEMLGSDWTSEQLLNQIGSISKPVNLTTNIYTLFSNRDRSKENMIKPNEFYYHNLLRSLPGPPRTEWDIDSGDIITINDDYFLEMRASITLGQIVDYYCKAFDVVLDPASINRYKGSIKYMIEKLGIDVVLFMIDAASDIIKAGDLQRPSSPVAIGEYEPQAREAYYAKVSENKVSGDDFIVFKPRVLPGGIGRKEKEPQFPEEQFNYA